MERITITQTTHLILSDEKLKPVPPCEGGIMKSLRFATFLKPRKHDPWGTFERYGLVSTQPETVETKPELWILQKGGSFSDFFYSFKVQMNYDCPLVWKSQWQIEKFCEENPDIVKKYDQGLYFLVERVGRSVTGGLCVIDVEQKAGELNPGVSTYSIIYAGPIDERYDNVKLSAHCLVVPETWRDPVRERKNPLDSM